MYSIVILMVIIGYECKCIQGTTRFIQNEFIKVMLDSIMVSIHYYIGEILNNVSPAHNV